MRPGGVGVGLAQSDLADGALTDHTGPAIATSKQPHHALYLPHRHQAGLEPSPGGRPRVWLRIRGKNEMTKRFGGFPFVLLAVLGLGPAQAQDLGVSRDFGNWCASRGLSGPGGVGTSSGGSRGDAGSRATGGGLGVAKSFSDWCASRGLPGPGPRGATSGPSLGINMHLEVASLGDIEQAARAVACLEACHTESWTILKALVGMKTAGDVWNSYEVAAKTCRTGMYSGPSAFDLAHQGGPTSQAPSPSGSSSFDGGGSDHSSSGNSSEAGGAGRSAFDGIDRVKSLR
jgi:hypothetical protein